MGALAHSVEHCVNSSGSIFHEAKMTKPKAGVLRRKKSEPTLAEQLAALDKLRELVRRIEADRTDRNAGTEQESRRKNKAPFRAA